MNKLLRARLFSYEEYSVIMELHGYHRIINNRTIISGIKTRASAHAARPDRPKHGAPQVQSVRIPLVHPYGRPLQGTRRYQLYSGPTPRARAW
jgi:hypothetical protein